MNADWIWTPHAGHFICASRCNFRLNTFVGGYIVSTVGEMFALDSRYDSRQFEKIGCDRLYETMVFNAKIGLYACCPYEADTSKELDFCGYNTPEEAYSGHLQMCEKWSHPQEIL